ncbi:MAG TPA: ABC transporter ATP-binding protein [Pyrinomonadaceae bacterium]|nr:ABC transporter ATP-binding protein [Pyrinomonadaceae bacterium]
MRVIKAENLAKLYRLGGTRHNSLRDTLMEFVRFKRGDRNELWALDDVSFEVEDGVTLGIIGRNGAGKSTLLKILSRITKPTRGFAEIRGRVGSLLEVGTGFHNELSGRENIYLSGAILGMTRAEIQSKFDEIVAFSEIEKFIDTPVKHYSSGMYMRLAFAVASHLEPDILIVDEVLAVGDTAFQKKCLSKMRDVGKTGRTVLFVSHDMQAINRLCERTIWFKDGRIEQDGETSSVVGAYLHEQSLTGAERVWDDQAAAPGNEHARLRRIRIADESGSSVSSVDIRRPVFVEMTFDALNDKKVLIPNFHFYNDQGVCLFVSHDWSDEWRRTPRRQGTYVARMKIPGNFLAEGSVFVTAAVSTYEPFEIHFVERETIVFTVVDSPDGDTARGDYAGQLHGVVRPLMDWETEFKPKP